MEQEQKHGEEHTAEPPVTFGRYYVRMSDRQKRYLKIRWQADRILAAAALAVLSPVFAAVGIALKISAPHEPVFFLQKRVGMGAHCFHIVKFRTLRSTAPKNVATGELENVEQYLSPLGRFLRRTSIDELPQLINVVRGEMALIGPRPLVYTEREIRFLRRWYGVYQVKPGLTGWAQVNGRDTVSLYDKVYYDREYIQKVSPLFDLKIILKSITVVLSRDGIVEGKMDDGAGRESVVLKKESEWRKKLIENDPHRRDETDDTLV